MTARVTTLKGADAGAYYVEALPNYYLEAGEPAGCWLGRGAELLGLAGEVDADAFLAVMDGRRPDRPDRRLGGRFGERSVRGFDVTCSAPKSVSVLWALGDDHTRAQVVAAHDAAVAAVAGWIDTHAHTRYRIGGQIAVVDADGIVAAAFRQHTSRALDPQLHSHLVIANRVRSPDGRWLALDARLLKRDQRSLSALYHAGLRAELTARLEVRWLAPVNGIAEIADLPGDLLDAFSTRTSAVRARIDAKLDRFTDTMGREATPRERWRLEREAVLDSRPAKPHDVDGAELLEQWAAQARLLGHDPAAVVTGAVGRAAPHRPDRHDASRVVDVALGSMQERQSSWRPTELHREIAAATPTTVPSSAAAMVGWVDEMAATVARDRCVDLTPPPEPGALLRRDGRPVSESAVDRALTTQAILDQETELLAWAQRRHRYTPIPHPHLTPARLPRLDTAQVEAAAAVAGSADLVLIVGPAGTGKTTALSPAVAALQHEHRPVFGVAPSATAAQVLAEETGVAADTIDMFLLSHQHPRPGALPVGATVIVDEAGMLATDKLAQLAHLADVRGWRIVLVGDPHQFSAVDRGGMFGLLVETHGAIELDQVRRFTHHWERIASLQLRAGNPDVADLYEQHGRLNGGTSHTMERAITRAWHQHRHHGRSVLLMAPTGDAVERLNQCCQQLRLEHGELDPNGPTLAAGPYRLRVGDEVMTRHNDRRLVTDTGEHVRNRATWTITTVHPDSAVTVTGATGTITLPAGYVAEYVDLAYARTAMGAQGRTVDIGLVYLDRATDIRNLYVPMTRGRDRNDAYIAVNGEETARDVFAQSVTTDWIDQPAHTRRRELHAALDGHHPGLLDGADRRHLADERDRLTRAIDQARHTINNGDSERDRLLGQVGAAQANLDQVDRDLAATDATIRRYNRPLIRKLHETDLATARRDRPTLTGRRASASHHLDRVINDLARHDRHIDRSHQLLASAPQAEVRRHALDELLDADKAIREVVSPPGIARNRPRRQPPSRGDDFGIEL